jgi:hypothetical protein
MESRYTGHREASNTSEGQGARGKGPGAHTTGDRTGSHCRIRTGTPLKWHLSLHVARPGKWFGEAKTLQTATQMCVVQSRQFVRGGDKRSADIREDRGKAREIRGRFAGRVVGWQVATGCGPAGCTVSPGQASCVASAD